jgi:putative nucleotidyltransferase with HDIG domain
MINKQEALDLLHSKMQSQNLRKHCYSVAAVMRALAEYFIKNDPESVEVSVDTWEIAGLLHDADYEKHPDKHPSVILDELEKRNENPGLIAAIRAHAWGYRDEFPKPSNKFEWSLYCCDELTGLITACALVRPDKSLASVDVDSVQRKWKQKSFAAGVDRTNIEHCEKELGIPLKEFIHIALTAMQGISKELGL